MSISANEFNKATITDSNPSGDKNCPMDAQHAATVHKITLKTLTEWAGGKWFTLHCEKKFGSAPTPLMWAFFFVIILGLCTNTNDNTDEIAIVDTTAVNVSKLLANKRSRDSAEEAAAEGDGAAAAPTFKKRRRDSVARSTTTSAAHSSASSAVSSSAPTKPSSQGPAAKKSTKGKTPS